MFHTVVTNLRTVADGWCCGAVISRASRMAAGVFRDEATGSVTARLLLRTGKPAGRQKTRRHPAKASLVRRTRSDTFPFSLGQQRAVGFRPHRSITSADRIDGPATHRGRRVHGSAHLWFCGRSYAHILTSPTYARQRLGLGVTRASPQMSLLPPRPLCVGLIRQCAEQCDTNRQFVRPSKARHTLLVARARSPYENIAMRRPHNVGVHNKGHHASRLSGVMSPAVRTDR
jgi:hypothetical protein